MRWVLRSKLHNASVTEANVDYVGSISIDKELIDRCGFWVGERVQVVSNTSGARLTTYVIEAPFGSRSICMNGAAAHLIKEGEQIIVMGFELVTDQITPRIVLVDHNNAFLENLGAGH
ncbi:MAG: aspartate 1-decarboxylase [Gammaproteobacteria bacterium]|nr:aspartate 1-decarboxylase [Gammaproteobacteria bacterium]